MTDTTPTDGPKNDNPDAPTERLDTPDSTPENTQHGAEHGTDQPVTPASAPAEPVFSAAAHEGAPEPTTVADPDREINGASTTTPDTTPDITDTTPDYVPGEPVDYTSDAPTAAAAAERTAADRDATDRDADTVALERTEPERAAEPTAAEIARDEAAAAPKDYTPTYVPPTPAAAFQPAPTAVQPTAQQPTAVQPTAVQPTQQQFASTPIYVTAPTPPKTLGNRAAGILIGLIATAVFTLVYAGVAFVISASGAVDVADATARFTDFIVLPVFYVPVIFFFLAFALLVAIVNRGGWWAYVLGGFAVAVVVYFSYIGGALLAVQAWNLTPSEATRFITSQWLNPGAIAAAVVAREVPIWFGGWIARRGRSVTAKNVAARQEYERQLAEGPQVAR